MMPYSVSAEAFNVPGDTALMSVQPQENAHAGLCALAVHEWQGVTVYNLRKRMVRRAGLLIANLLRACLL